MQFKRGNILTIGFGDGTEDPIVYRTFVYDGEGHMYPVIAGYSVTTVYQDEGSGRMGFVTHAPLPTNEDVIPRDSFVKLNERYPLLEQDHPVSHLQNVEVVGSLSETEMDAFDRMKEACAAAVSVEEQTVETFEMQIRRQYEVYDCIKNDEPERLRELLKEGAEADITGADIQPLFYAARCGNFPCAEELLRAGAYPDALNSGVQSALDIAINTDNVALADLLMRYGADPDTSVMKESVAALSLGMKSVLYKTSNHTATFDEFEQLTHGNILKSDGHQQGGGRS